MRYNRFVSLIAVLGVGYGLNILDVKPHLSRNKTLTTSKVETISNGIVSVGVDLNVGCAVTSFVDLSSGVNMINTYDLGREIQPSFYGGPNNYEGCIWSGQEWPWNPIGAGDAYGNPSEVLSVINDGSTITCKIIPMQWACNNIPCECTFEMTYTLQGSALYSSVTLSNHRSDTTDYTAYQQEYPAVYVNGFLYRLFTYTGSEPWTNAPLEEYDAGFDEWWVPGHLSATENFVAFLNEDKFAVAVYNPGSEVDNIIGGFYGKKGSGGTSDSPTGYMAPNGNLAIGHDDTFTYEYVVLMGNIDDVRGSIYSMHSGISSGVSLKAQFTPAGQSGV